MEDKLIQIRQLYQIEQGGNVIRLTLTCSAAT